MHALTELRSTLAEDTGGDNLNPIRVPRSARMPRSEERGFFTHHPCQAPTAVKTYGSQSECAHPARLPKLIGASRS